MIDPPPPAVREHLLLTSTNLKDQYLQAAICWYAVQESGIRRPIAETDQGLAGFAAIRSLRGSNWVWSTISRSSLLQLMQRLLLGYNLVLAARHCAFHDVLRGNFSVIRSLDFAPSMDTKTPEYTPPVARTTPATFDKQIIHNTIKGSATMMRLHYTHIATESI